MKGIFARIGWLCLAGMLAANPVQGQTEDFAPVFETFFLPGGHLGNSVQSMAQDDVGFLWFGTQNGLYRYDGQ